MPLRLDIPISNPPIVPTSGYVSDIYAAQRAARDYEADYELRVMSLYQCDSRERNTIYRAVIGQYTDLTRFLVYRLTNSNKPELKLVSGYHLSGYLVNGWELLDHPFNMGKTANDLPHQSDKPRPYKTGAEKAAIEADIIYQNIYGRNSLPIETDTPESAPIIGQGQPIPQIREFLEAKEMFEAREALKAKEMSRKRAK